MSAQRSGQQRVVIEGVQPEIDGGRFVPKASIGEMVRVEADIFADGHDAIAAVVRWRSSGSEAWQEVRMRPTRREDRWAAGFFAESIGRHEFVIEAWIDRFGSWRRDFAKRVAAGQDVNVDAEVGVELIAEAVEAARRTGAGEARRLEQLRQAIHTAEEGKDKLRIAVDEELGELMFRFGPRRFAVEHGARSFWVDRERARFSTWYELFPRSAGAKAGKHGTLRDVAQRLDVVAGMGFDVLYLPPIHPIGRTHRKGKNNRPSAEADDVGSPWAIGAAEGGHKAIHPELGTFDDFAALVEAAAKRKIEIAMDIAFQCSPDHPYVREHPEWFRARPDGTIQYAENPPKKYQDIYPFDFETPAWESLWDELLSVLLFWAERGVRIFRVDNPHTKAFGFWEWAIAQVQAQFPDVIFLAEAFTRPKVMYRLAKLGFTQSYTYFAWKNSGWELKQYFEELTQTEAREFFRPNAWPNTPDILNEFLQQSGRAGFQIRLVLAATLAANYGIYGPVYELLQGTPREHGSEEYLDSEKYQLRTWDWSGEGSIRGMIARVNAIRHENPALQQDRTLRFHPTDNQELLCYSKMAGENTIICIVNMNPRQTQWGNVELDLEELEIPADRPYQLHDLLSDARYTWQGRRNVVGLDPGVVPAHIFRLRRKVRSEQDFEYFL